MTKTAVTPTGKQVIGAASGTLIKGVKMAPGNGYLQFMYNDANGKKQPLPVGTPIKIYYLKGSGRRSLTRKTRN